MSPARVAKARRVLCRLAVRPGGRTDRFRRVALIMDGQDGEWHRDPAPTRARLAADLRWLRRVAGPNAIALRRAAARERGPIVATALARVSARVALRGARGSILR